MKFLFLFIMLFSFSSFSAEPSWVCKDEIIAKSIDKAWGKNFKAQCDQACSSVCYDISGKDIRKVKMGMVNSKTVAYSKRDVLSCSDEETCLAAMQSLDCSGYASGSFPMFAEALDEAYCAEPNGFIQIEAIVEESSSEIQKVVDADNLKKAKADKKKLIRNRKACGNKIIEEVQLLTDSKAWSDEKYDSLEPTFDIIEKRLKRGRIAGAIRKTQSYGADNPSVIGVDIMQAELDAMIALMQACP